MCTGVKRAATADHQLLTAYSTTATSHLPPTHSTHLQQGRLVQDAAARSVDDVEPPLCVEAFERRARKQVGRLARERAVEAHHARRGKQRLKAVVAAEPTQTLFGACGTLRVIEGDLKPEGTCALRDGGADPAQTHEAQTQPCVV